MHVEVPASHGTEICAIIIKAFRPPLDTVVVFGSTPSLAHLSQLGVSILKAVLEGKRWILRKGNHHTNRKMEATWYLIYQRPR